MEATAGAKIAIEDAISINQQEMKKQLRLLPQLLLLPGVKRWRQVKSKSRSRQMGLN